MRRFLPKPSASNRGQMLLITILVLTVATTIGLSLIGRSTVDVSMTSQLEDSSRAFSAAEAGIEKALQSGLGTNGPEVLTAGSGVTYNVTVGTVGGTTGVYRVAHKTRESTTETLWLVNHNADGTIDESSPYTGSTLTLCWESQTTQPALIGSILYKHNADASYRMAKFAIDPTAADRGNNFDSAYTLADNGCGLSNFYSKTINFASLGIAVGAGDTLIQMRVRPEYSDTTIAIDAGANTLPKQGNVIESVGQTGSGVSRKVVVYQQYRTAGSIFDNVIYSQSSFDHSQ